ncbi:MAG: hypothetical protein KGO96_04470 [Elusimicrobia bacterium]|nr:hypothetical protein [Elusimicrobiota bacterium]MDE2236973.1 hypothetical protein [Elusimicrobiota bacterium]MDE2425147.1 hypothetical protein [Elusimicrobiota bacterium]
MAPGQSELDEQIRQIEERFLQSARELSALRQRLLRQSQAELEEIKDEWHGVHYKWWVATLAGALGLFVLAFHLYTRLGWVADHRILPNGSDWLLRHLPVVNVLPVLSWGWLALHLFAAGCAIAYYPRRIPFLIFLLALFMAIRTIFVFLSPIGAPMGMLDMGKLDFLFSKIMGAWTFENEFVFSGHTGIPFLFFLFFETRGLKAIMLIGSLTMAVCVLLSHNHYTVDVLGAYLVSYSIFKLAEKLYYDFIRPLFQVLPSATPY